jgi:hypothetical protein
MLHMEYTLQKDVDDVLPFVRRDIVEALPKLLPDIQEEVEVACHSHFGRCGSHPADGTHWSEVRLLPVALAIIGQVICRVLLGETLSRNPEFIRLATDFTHELAFVSVILDWCPRWLRRFVVSVLPFSEKKRRLKKMMKSVILDSIAGATSNNEKGSSQTVRCLSDLLRASDANRLGFSCIIRACFSYNLQPFYGIFSGNIAIR